MARDDVLILDAGDAAAFARRLRDMPHAQLVEHSPRALRRAAQLLTITVYLADQAARKCVGAARQIEQQETACESSD